MPRFRAAVVLALVSTALACEAPLATAPAAPPAEFAVLANPGMASVGETAVSVVYDWRFSPNRFTVAQGTTVTWDFVGPKGHTIRDVSGLGLYSSGSAGGAGRPGYKLSYTFTVAGTYD